MQQQIDDLQEDIHSEIYEIVEDTSKAGKIVNDVNTLGTLYEQKFVGEIKGLKNSIRTLETEVKNLSNELDNKILEVEEHSKRSVRLNNYTKCLFIIRSYLNKQFRYCWNIYENKIKETITHEMLCSLSKRENIYDDVGYKFAVYILCVTDKIPELISFPTELCQFYVLLNEKMHPSIIPHSIVVSAVQKLRNSVNEPLMQEYRITRSVLDDIENFLN
jgi:uncharacterized protein YoxC